MMKRDTGLGHPSERVGEEAVQVTPVFPPLQMKVEVAVVVEVNCSSSPIYSFIWIIIYVLYAMKVINIIQTFCYGPLQL